uniref:Uncharacterized protein n=1 Tax=Avena sativa TaxID=4498 RepID=A0ACD5Y963_AVESA
MTPVSPGAQLYKATQVGRGEGNESGGAKHGVVAAASPGPGRRRRWRRLPGGAILVAAGQGGPPLRPGAGPAPLRPPRARGVREGLPHLHPALAHAAGAPPPPPRRRPPPLAGRRDRRPHRPPLLLPVPAQLRHRPPLRGLRLLPRRPRPRLLPRRPPWSLHHHIRFLARFLLVALILARRAHTVPLLATKIRALLDESKKTLQEADYREWKHVVQEITRFLKADSPFMNMRPLRYSYAFDPPPDNLPTIPPTVKKRGLLLSDAILCSYYHNEVKFTDLTLDTFRMLQCLEWEPCGSFALNNGYSAHDEGGQNHPNLLKDLRDAALPSNPLKTVLYRPSMPHFLKVLATKCEELPLNGMMLIYLSAAGEMGTSGLSPDTSERVVSSFSKFDISITRPVNSKEDKEPSLWLGCRESEGSNCIYPSDLIPFTRRPLFLVIDSSVSYAFKSIHGAEKGETAAMLLSPSSRSSAVGFSGDSTRQSGSQFTMFLTAPVQAFCSLIGKNGLDIDRNSYNKAEELLSVSLNEWATTLVASSSLDPVWVEVLGDPLLRRLLLRFIFCRATLSLLKASNNKAEFLPSCVPPLPESVGGESMLSQCCVMRVASFLGAADQFSFAEVTTWPDVDEPTGSGGADK